MPKKQKTKSERKDGSSEASKALEKAARKIENSGIRDYVEFLSSPWRVFGINFLVGTARGLGLIIGVSMVIALVGYIITQILVDLPIVGEFFTSLYEFLKANGFPDSSNGDVSMKTGIDTYVAR